MTPREWVEGVSAGATLILLSMAGISVYMVRAIRSWRSLLAELKRQATTAAEQSTAAATSAAKVDDSMHTNNGGSHQKDVIDQVLSTLRDLRRDVGGMREDIRTLARVDQADREAEAAEHVRLWAAIDRRS